MITEVKPEVKPDTGKRYHLPPGLPVNLLLLTNGQFRPRDPIRLFEYMTRKYGEISTYKVAHLRIVFINKPEYIREVLVNQAANFTKERVQRRSKMLLGDGMITSEGAYHKAQRRAVQPAFYRERIASYGEAIVRNAAELSESIVPGSTIDISQTMMRLSLGVAAEALFRTRMTADEVVAMNQSVNEIMKVYHFLVALPAAEQLLPFPIPGLIQFRRARQRLDRQIFEMIHHRRSQGEPGELLTMMIEGQPEATDEQIRDQVTTILLAGFETTANALSWTWYLLAQNPEVETQLHAELDAVLSGRLPTADDYPNLPYTEMVLAEAMRLYPPAWAMGRQAIAPFELGPYRLPAKTTVLMSQWVMHRSLEYFPDPLRFDPTRFSPEAKRARDKFTYFPFGGGPRQCIGEAFAWLEAVLILATLAQRWRAKLVPGQKIVPEQLITLRPKGGIRMEMVARR